ncbi:hypothetical protein PBI_SMARTIES_4 [Microbacterium phage Smarties]|uniref:Uncharacterized protein n=1 Tax=Microbacterium phage Ariadne TaxID=2656546 RepID=A0A649VBB6_9CAUD|nr:hypothetical protein QDA10_gp004 [Microbacterium phage Ariadne]QGJ89409.1 hypothetical protein PBI_ARIADNE_4 [Microbacterium phage Ariadne]QGJ91396.1 hypothetical protein PBI_SMARTIES_4 [Microbacterium phage Smarties]
MTRCMSASARYPSTPCTLGQSQFDHIEYPGPAIYYTYEGVPVPIWAPSVLPPSSLTPVRLRDLEEAIERMPAQFAEASTSTSSLADALLAMRDRMRGTR